MRLIMDANRVIDGCGGTRSVARAIGVKDSAVSNARKRNHIPWRWRPILSELARAKNFELPEGFWPPKPEKDFANNIGEAA